MFNSNLSNLNEFNVVHSNGNLLEQINYYRRRLVNEILNINKQIEHNHETNNEEDKKIILKKRKTLTLELIKTRQIKDILLFENKADKYVNGSYDAYDFDYNSEENLDESY